MASFGGERGFQISLIAAVITALNAVRALYNYTRNPAELPVVGLLLTILIPVGAVLWAFLSRRERRRAETQQPVAPGAMWVLHHERCFEGRLEYTDQIARRCLESRLLLLSGEGGVGKTALLEVGLTRQLKSETSGLLPIYVSGLAGPDWVQDALVRTTEAVYREARALLSADDFRKLPKSPARTPGSYHSDAEVAHLRELLTALQRCSARTPCLLLDQIDDYLQRHRAHFVVDEQVLTPAELVSRNAFWALIDEGLRVGAIRCVIASRPRPDGLDALSLAGGWRTTLLEPLRGGQAEALLSEMARRCQDQRAAGPWLELAFAVRADLGEKVLPVQLRTMLLGLAAMENVRNAAAYRRLGRDRESRIARVEREYLRLKLVSTASHHGVSEGALHNVLRTIVEAMGTGRPLPETEMPATGISNPEVLIAALEELQEWGITRRIKAGWQLDHQYLCRPLQDLIDREQRLDRVLAEAQSAWSRAVTTRECWRATVPLSDQPALFWAYARRRLSYRPAGLLILGLSRIVINWVTPGVALVALSIGVPSYCLLGRARDRPGDVDRRCILLRFDTGHERSAGAQSIRRGRFVCSAQGRVCVG